MVINDDLIAPHCGFDPHPHKNMEIITYVRRGAITHKDNKGHKGRTPAGHIQVMSAGAGIRHSEYNLEDEETSLFQIWITPQKRGIAPRWDMASFPEGTVKDRLHLLVSGDGRAPLNIAQDARLYAGRMKKGQQIRHKIKGQAYILISDGAAKIDSVHAHKGDGLSIKNQQGMSITATRSLEILVIEVPGKRAAR